MKQKWNIVLRCIAFCFVFALLFGQLTQYLRRYDDETNEMHAFYDEPKNSIDVLWIGSSPLLRGVSPMLMYQEHGFTGYVRASALQAPAVSYALLEESLQYQNPEVVVLLCDNLFQKYDYVEREGDLRRALDGMKFSSYKWSVIQEVTKADDRQTSLSYLFPLFRYHERWKEINLAEAEPQPLLEHSFKKGHVYLHDVAPQVYPDGFMQPTGEQVTFDDSAYDYAQKSIALCKEKGIDVVLLHLPKVSWSFEKSQAMAQFAEEQQIPYVDFNTKEIQQEIGLLPEQDYYDKGHVNTKGSKKVSEWLGAYLAERYDLPNHRNDVAYEQWEQDLEQYLKGFTKKE